MAQHALRTEKGMVALELMLCMPLLLLFLVLILNLEAVLRCHWRAQMGARLAAWHMVQTRHALPSDRARELVRICDPEVTTVTVEWEDLPLTSETLLTKYSLILPGGNAQWQEAMTGGTAHCRVEQSGKWVPGESASYVTGGPGSSSEVVIRHNQYNTVSLDNVVGRLTSKLRLFF
jgi:hypothetical protein